jgi:hypothetical protein
VLSLAECAVRRKGCFQTGTECRLQGRRKCLVSKSSMWTRRLRSIIVRSLSIRIKKDDAWQMATYRSTTSDWCVALAILVAGITSPVCATAQNSALNQPVSSNEQDGAQATPKPAVVHLLSQRSLFFPSLAYSEKPLTPAGKFGLAVLNSTSPAAFLGSALGAGVGQAADSPAGYGQGAEGYFKRFGGAMATNASTNLFGTFLLASLAHHDPRHFVEGNGSFRQSVKYGLRRVVFTRTDDGQKAFNWDGLTAPLLAVSLANAYKPDADRTAANTFTRYGIAIAVTAGVNVLKEFWPTITKKVLVPIHMNW